MTTKLSNRQILNLHEALTEIRGTAVDGKSLPFKVTYALARTLSSVREHKDAIDQARAAVVGKHTDGKGGLMLEDPQFLAAQAAVEELLGMVVDVVLHQVKLDQLEHCGLSPKHLASLMPLIEE